MVEVGVKVFIGGYILEYLGCYYSLMLFENIKLGMFVYDDELFGFVVLFIRVKDNDEVM